MRSRYQSPCTVRVVSTLLALVWLGAGFAAIVLALMSPSRWLLGVVGVAAVWYGLLWVRVARLGRRLTLREAFTPWRAGRQPDA